MFQTLKQVITVVSLHYFITEACILISMKFELLTNSSLFISKSWKKEIVRANYEDSLVLRIRHDDNAAYLIVLAKIIFNIFSNMTLRQFINYNTELLFLA